MKSLPSSIDLRADRNPQREGKMANKKIVITIEDIDCNRVYVKSTPTVEEIIKGQLADGHKFTAAEGYALHALNAIQQAARSEAKKLPIFIPRVGRV